MPDLSTWIACLPVMLSFGFAFWIVSLAKRDVSVVDILWPLLFLIAGISTFFLSEPGPRAVLMLTLVAVWAFRLSIYLAWRNFRNGEDRRYRAIRQNNEPRFWLKSLYLIFAFQVTIAWIIALPVVAAVESGVPLRWLDGLGVALWSIGFVFETVGDYQLARFKADAGNRGRILDSGLWRYTRHPNYFGNACVWWGIFLIALASGAWWTVVSPLLMTYLLLKFSGVPMLEDSIVARYPQYRDYRQRTSSFLPWFPRKDVSPFQPGTG